MKGRQRNHSTLLLRSSGSVDISGGGHTHLDIEKDIFTQQNPGREITLEDSSWFCHEFLYLQAYLVAESRFFHFA